jgi:hypothetical protein
MIDATALMFAGITPPDRGCKTTCPKCSATRRKSSERCLVVRTYQWGMQVYCYHCGYKDGIV